MEKVLSDFQLNTITFNGNICQTRFSFLGDFFSFQTHNTFDCFVRKSTSGCETPQVLSLTYVLSSTWKQRFHDSKHGRRITLVCLCLIK